MAQPVMGGGPPAGAMTPPYGAQGSAPMGGPPISGGAPHAAVPAAPPRAQKSGPPVGLIVGLLGLAGVIVAVAVYFGVIRKSGPAPVATVDTATTTSSSTAEANNAGAGAAAPTEDPNASVTPVTPLGGGPSTAAVVHTGGGPKPSSKPIPTPKPSAAPPPDPPICATARRAKERGSPMAARLEAQCVAAGGKL